MNKSTLTALGLLALFPALFSLKAFTDAPAHDGSLSDPDIRYVGRWDKTKPDLYHSYWTGAYLRTGFTGTSVGIKLASQTTLAVSIDGEPPRSVGVGSGVTPLNTAPLGPGRHSLVVGSAGQNEELSFQGLTLAPGGKTFAPTARPIVEFVGDSISAGVFGNYCWMTGEALGADHTQISFSGRSLTSGFGCLADKVGLDTQYFRLKNFNHMDDKPPVDWNMSYTPKVVVINLGQNDQCGAEPADTMTASYTDFLKKLRAAYPQTHLVALRTFGGPYEASIKAAVAARNASRDAKVHYIDTTGWLQKEDFGDGVHPNAGGGVKVAARLTPLLRSMLGGPAAVPATVTVGDPKKPGALPQEALNAYLAGAKRIVVRPGTYVMPNAGRTSFTLDGWENATLSGAGATIILTDLEWMHDCFDLNRCNGVTLQGFLLSQNAVVSYQGRVVAVGKNADGKPYADWRSDAGYAAPEPKEKGFLGGEANVVDAHTRLLKPGNPDNYNVVWEPLGDGLYRAHMGGDISIGDWLVGRHGGAPFKLFVNNSRNCVMKDITLMRNGFASIREADGGGNRYLRIRWALGPRPAGATENPVVTNEADGMHMTASDPGPDIEDCRFEGVFLDDCIAIHGYFQTVTAASGTSVTLKGGPLYVKVGQPVRISDEKGFFAQGMVMAMQENKATDGKDNATTTLTLDKDYHVPASAKLSNPRAGGAGFKIIGCHLGSTRSRGILVKADNGLIKNNVLENCGMSAVSIGPEYYWGEADYAQNVTVENNTIRNCGNTVYGGTAILVHGDGAVGNKNIVIRNNTMSSNLQGDMELQWVAGVTIVGNTMSAPVPGVPGMKIHSPVALDNCRDITLRGNTVRNAAGYDPVLASAGASATNVQNNDPSGIRVVDAKASASSH